MSKSVTKYDLGTDAEQTIKLPHGSEPLCLEVQGQKLSLYVEVDTDAVLVDQVIYIHATDAAINGGPAQYVGTVFGGSSARHVYWRSNAVPIKGYVANYQ